MRRRQGFTIVELLVAMALILFVMVILTEAFSAGMAAFRQLKAIGDMQEKMRTASLILRRDLMADHFNELRGNRLSDQDLRNNQPPPNNGYFRLVQSYQSGSPNNYFQGSAWEGKDPDNLPSTRSPAKAMPSYAPSARSPYGTWMAFTVRLWGTSPQDYYTADLGVPISMLGTPPPPPAWLSQLATTCGPADYNVGGSSSINYTLQRMLSHWAEVAYFLRPMERSPGTGVPLTTPGGTNLYALYRRQRLLNDSSTTLTVPGGWQYFYDVSLPQPTAGTATVNTPSTITIPENRLGMDPSTTGGLPGTLPTPNTGSAIGAWTIQDLLGGPAAAGTYGGDDILLTNVISFDIKVLAEGMTNYGATAANPLVPAHFVDLPLVPSASGPLVSNNSVFAANNLLVFDTWTTQNNPNLGSSTYATGWNTPSVPTSLPLSIRVLALQITLRVWDDRTQQARQMTIIQDM